VHCEPFLSETGKSICVGGRTDPGELTVLPAGCVAKRVDVFPGIASLMKVRAGTHGFSLDEHSFRHLFFSAFACWTGESCPA
jgi:hypothetical protein